LKERKINIEISARKLAFINKKKSQLNNDIMGRGKFLCPNCDSESISITNDKLLAKVKCLTCYLSGEIKINRETYSSFDVYGDFIDLYYADEEIQRLERNIEPLKNSEKWRELTHNYSILSYLYSAKRDCLLKDGNNPGPDEISNWNLKSEKYKTLEKETRLKIDSKVDDESFKESKRIKKEKKIEDVFDDPGFLEF